VLVSEASEWEIGQSHNRNPHNNRHQKLFLIVHKRIESVRETKTANKLKLKLKLNRQQVD